MSPEPIVPTAADTPKPSPWSATNSIARWLGRDDAPTGERAGLRRMDVSGPLVEPSFHRVVAMFAHDDAPGPGMLRRYAVLVHCLALASGLALPGERAKGSTETPKVGFKDRLGGALHEASYSEARLTKLLNGGADDLAVTLPRMVRFLVAKGQAFDRRGLTGLLFNAPDSDKGREARQSIAADFYRAEHAAKSKAGAAA